MTDNANFNDALQWVCLIFAGVGVSDKGIDFYKHIGNGIIVIVVVIIRTNYFAEVTVRPLCCCRTTRTSSAAQTRRFPTETCPGNEISTVLLTVFLFCTCYFDHLRLQM
jgi:hypothetical protein